MRPTTDAVWSAAHENARELDIAHTDWDDLPADWKDMTSAEIAVREVEIAAASAGDSEKVFDESFVERVAELIHVAWLEKRGATATPVQLEDYRNLPHEEKVKDRLFVESAIKFHQEGIA